MRFTCVSASLSNHVDAAHPNCAAPRHAARMFVPPFSVTVLKVVRMFEPIHVSRGRGNANDSAVLYDAKYKRLVIKLDGETSRKADLRIGDHALVKINSRNKAVENPPPEYFVVQRLDVYDSW